MQELAAAVSTWAGRNIPYEDVPASAHRNALARAGLPQEMVDFLVTTDTAISRGDVDTSSRDLHALIGRDTRTLEEVLAALPKPEQSVTPK